MKTKLFLLFLFISLTVCAVFADAFVLEFNTMQKLRCDFEETIYNSDNSIVTKNKQFRVFMIDEPYKKIYLQKQPIANVTYYESDKIEFDFQSMTDDFIMMSHVVINRANGEYSSVGEITYDNPVFGTRHSKSHGICKIVN